MIQIFNRYIPSNLFLYFIFENVFIFLFVIWGSAFKGMTPNLFLVPLACQIALHYSDLNLHTPQFPLKNFLRKHLFAIFWTALIFFGLYRLLPLPPFTWNPITIRLVLSPLILIGLRFGYHSMVTTHKLDTSILIIGSGSNGTLVKEALSQNKGFGYRVLHFNQGLGSPSTNNDTWKKLTEVVSKERIKKIVVALKDRRGQLPVKLLLNLRVQGIEVVDAVNFYEQIAGKICVKTLNPSTLIFGRGFNRLEILRISKRILDILTSLIGIMLALPMFIILPILIKLTSQGPVFYRQVRVGEKGNPFTLIKFRSMVQDAESKSGPVWAVENDSRVTWFGKIMRALRLDELPQLINVLKGEMSFVGPRPERPVFVKQLQEKIPYYDLRFSVKPGLTGWAQVKYRYGSTEEDALEKLQYDLYYVKHLSLLFDMTIIFETIQVVLRGKGAR
ncbi:MAG: sugar transferase [Verrucomicrobiales bacterium]|nr:sugar transferase [Nitrospinaceae bacterium]